MADCEMLPNCSFFNDLMRGMPKHAELFKELYCRGGKSICARYIVCRALGKEVVPPDLFPNEVSRADCIVEANRKTSKRA
jgi:hypothetical protein